MKKVLIIVYYWTPSGGAGVQRWVKFVKYLRDFGWEPIIYTPKENEIPVEDHSFDKDIPEDITILQTKIWEPYNLYKKFIRAEKNEKLNTGGFISTKKKEGVTNKISTFIRGNFFIPDARKFWIKPSVKFLTSFLKHNSIDLIISSGPPHSMHLIALNLKKHTNIPWIADFRDPWTKIYMYKDLMLTHFADNTHKRLERKVLKNANYVTTVSHVIAQELKELGAIKTAVVHNGYDEDDFKNLEVQKMSDKFSIVHTGAISKSKNQTMLWNILGELKTEYYNFNNDLEIILAGQLDFTCKEDIKRNNLEENTIFYDYLPHDQVIELQKKSSVLLLMISNTLAARGALTGKIFEYLAAERPIIAIAPTDGEIAALLKKTNAGVVVDFDDAPRLKTMLIEYYHQFKNHSLKINQPSHQKFTRKNLTAKMVEIMNLCIKSK